MEAIVCRSSVEIYEDGLVDLHTRLTKWRTSLLNERCFDWRDREWKTIQLQKLFVMEMSVLTFGELRGWVSNILHYFVVDDAPSLEGVSLSAVSTVYVCSKTFQITLGPKCLFRNEKGVFVPKVLEHWKLLEHRKCLFL